MWVIKVVLMGYMFVMWIGKGSGKVVFMGFF